MELSGKAVDFTIEFFEQIENKDLNGLIEHFDDSGCIVLPGLRNTKGFNFGKDKICRIFKKLFSVMPNVSFEVKNVLSAGDRISAEWNFSGNTKKGKPVSGAGSVFFDMTRNNLIEEARMYITSDSFSLK